MNREEENQDVQQYLERNAALPITDETQVKLKFNLNLSLN